LHAIFALGHFVACMLCGQDHVRGSIPAGTPPATRAAMTSNARLVVLSALLAVLSFGLMTSSALMAGDPAAVTAMNVGQGLAVLSLAAYGGAFLRGMKKARVFGGQNDTESRGS
jgi:hypothetical protein